MRELILLIGDMGSSLVKPLTKQAWPLGSQSLAVIIGWGILAFCSYEILITLLLDALNLRRNSFVFFVELCIFGLACTCLYFHSRTTLLNVRRTALASESGFRRRYEMLAQSNFEHFAKQASLSEGIEQSLSAVMFFARAHLAKSGNSQLQRDLMEVMERIDQIQMLLSEMKIPMIPGKGDETKGFRKQESKLSRDTKKDQRALESHYQVMDTPEPVYSLRKSARKTHIIPITVHYSSSDTRLEFQSYTINICESGACIVFSDPGIREDTIIEFQIPSEFQSRAIIKWVQPKRADSFGLAGIEFLDSRTLRTA
jgi:PilZ domain